MKVALIQSDLFWENSIKNCELFEAKINQIEPVDLIVLPEMFTSGFSMNAEFVAQTMQGEAILLLKKLAKSKNCAITGSLVISENNNFYNRMVFVFPDGNIEFYDKKHLFSLAGENKFYKPGDIKKIVTYKDFKICLQICYDLRFPVFARNKEDYDLLIYVASWPDTRINAWNILLKARAVENMSYVIGVNRVGTDDNNLNYTGNSQVIDSLGNFVLEPQTSDDVFVINLDKSKMMQNRAYFGFLKDRD